MKFVTIMALSFTLIQSAISQDAWTELPQSFSCSAPHEVLCNPATNPHLADLGSYLDGVFAQLQAASAAHDSRISRRACEQDPACGEARRREVWLSVFSPRRAEELQQLFVETKEDATRFLLAKKSQYLNSTTEPELKAERLRMLDLALSRLPGMTASPYQTEETLRRGSVYETTRYFHTRNQVEMGFLAVLPAKYDEAIRVVLGHEIAHAFGPSSLFKLDTRDQPPVDLYGVPVQSVFRNTYPMMDEIAALPDGYRGADVACLEPIRLDLAERLRTSQPNVRSCDNTPCQSGLAGLNACLKACTPGAEGDTCREACAPLREEYRTCLQNVCTDEERAVAREHNLNQNRYESIVRVIANPHDGGNRDAIQCGKAETEEALGDLLGFRWAVNRIAGNADAVRKLFLANATMYCRFIVNTPSLTRPGAHPEGSDRVNLIHFGVSGVREAHGCR